MACDEDKEVCTWSKICGWKSGKGPCSACQQCTNNDFLPKPTKPVGKCEDWCKGKIGKKTCNNNEKECSWLLMCGWQSGSCSACPECRALPAIEEMPAKTKNAGAYRQVPILAFTGMLATMLLS